MKKIYLLLIITTCILTGCYNQPEKSNTTPKEQQSLTEINKADEATVNQKLSLTKYYTTTIDGETYKLKGKFANFFGETITMTGPNGRVLYENQEKRYMVNVNRMAAIYNDDNQVIGYLGEDMKQDFLSLTRKYHIYNENGDEIAKISGKFTLLDSYDVTNMSGDVIYTIKKEFSWLSKYKIKKVKETDVPLTSIVLVTCVIDSIKGDDN